MNKKELLRGIPKIDDLLRQEPLFSLIESKGNVIVTDAARTVLEHIRSEILSIADCNVDKVEESFSLMLDREKITEKILNQIEIDEKPRLYPVINATGTILHTNLGRAPLCKDAIDNALRVSTGYSDLEYNVPEGKRGSRHDLVTKLLKELTGAEDAMVVNNNASATMIVLATLGVGREVVVSRGELVEIGGAFRIPDIMRQSGAFLQEVGTSNKTKLKDYEDAIVTAEDAESGRLQVADPRGAKRFETGALMKVHKSNYDILGFTQEVSLEELVELGKKKNLPVIFDMGNGLMTDMSEYGLSEPIVPVALDTGIDVILFSGDKLLGGPQAGIIAGKKKYIESMKKHPLARAIRVDKMTLAALESTLSKYKDRRMALRDIPVLRMISISDEDLLSNAEKLKSIICKMNNSLDLEIVDVEDQIGGGSAPMVRLKGYAVAVKDNNMSAQQLERKIRKADIPVIARIKDDRLLLCVRTLFETEFENVAIALK